MTHCCLRDGQSTDFVPKGLTFVGSEATTSYPWKETTLYQCDTCHQLWASWLIGGSFLWGKATVGKRPRWKQTFNSSMIFPPKVRRRWFGR